MAHTPDKSRLLKRLSEAEGYLMLNMPRRALELLRSQTWPGLAYESHYLTGEALRELGEIRDALTHLEKAVTLRDLSIELAIALGWCYKRSHRLAQAVEVLESAVKRHPREPLLRYNLACYWSLAGNLEKSLERLIQALEIDPGLHRLIADESDFDPIRDHPRFVRLAQGSSPTPDGRTGIS